MEEEPLYISHFVESVPCADCGTMVDLETEQEYTKDTYGRVLCIDCKETQEIKKDLIGILEAAGYGD